MPALATFEVGFGGHPHPPAWVSVRTPTLSRRGYEMGRIRSRRIDPQDFQHFDLILAMDASNLAELRRLCPPTHLSKLRLFLDFAEGLNETEVPDPHYGNSEKFEGVLDLCEAGASGLIKYYKM